MRGARLQQSLRLQRTKSQGPRHRGQQPALSEIVNLSDEDRNGYFADVDKVAKALHKAFSPDKINYGAYGGTGSHLHFHLVPKYKDEVEWGVPFAMNLQEKFLASDEEYEALAEENRANLQ